MNEKKFLTRSEFQVMIILWNLPGKGGYTKDILAGFDSPQPAYTTLATFLKILTNKGFVKSEKVGSMLYFTPIISKESYCSLAMAKAQNDYFNDDPVEFIRFIAGNNELTEEQKLRIREIIG